MGVDHEVFVTPATQYRDLPGIVEAQNVLIQRALDGKFDFLWLIQGDVEVPEGSFGSLYGLGIDVAFGVVPRHDDKDSLICGFLNENQKVWYLPRQAVQGQVLSGWVFASGCVLIARRVLEAGIKFRYQLGLGEDILFAYDVQKAGFTAKVDGRVVCGHLPEWDLSFEAPWDVLDVGCGHRPQGDVNVDLFPQPSAHRCADQRVNDDVALHVHEIPTFLVADATRLPFRSCAFRKVYSWHLIEHLSSPEAFLAECCRIASEEVEVRCPNGDPAWVYGSGAYGETKPLHVSRMTKERFERSLNSVQGWDWTIKFDYNQGEPYEIVVRGFKIV